MYLNIKKECAWHIPAPAAVACDIYLIRRSAHPRGAFFTLRKAISYKVKKEQPTYLDYSLSVTSMIIIIS